MAERREEEKWPRRQATRHRCRSAGRHGSPEDAGERWLRDSLKLLKRLFGTALKNTQTALEVTSGHSVLSDFQSVLSLLTPRGGQLQLCVVSFSSLVFFTSQTLTDCHFQKDNYPFFNRFTLFKGC